MKPNKIIVHPNIGNEKRQEIIDWCEVAFGSIYCSSPRWFQTSNYERGPVSGTFDIHFKEESDAHFFIIAHGGYIAERCFPNKFIDLFE